MKHSLSWFIGLVVIILLTIPALICVTIYWILIFMGFPKSDANKTVNWIDKVNSWTESKGL